VTANATVYLTRALSVASIRSAARLAKVSAVAGDVLAVVELGAIRVTVSQMPVDAVDAHLAGLRQFIVTRCDIEDDTFVSRIDAVVQVLGLVIEPEVDSAGKTMELILALARSGHGFAFDGANFRDRAGRVLAGIATTFDDPEAEGITGEITDAATGETPDGVRVLARAWVLSAVAVRSFLEDEPRPHAAEMIARIRQWLGSVGIDHEIEIDERELIDAPVGGLTPDRKADGTWRSEGLAVLGWALGVSELPDHATAVDAGAVATAVGFLAPTRPKSVAPPRLRSPAELDWMARRLTGLHWRLKEMWTNRTPIDFRSFSRNAWFGGFDLIGITLADDDLAIDGQPITRASRDRVKQCHSIAVERHQAIAWLRGLHRIYSKVDTAT